ncbi:MAG: phospholipid/cholesterol/gamma-HCH transport system substrate-binding protein [Solirubrobacteraceae bacterium]|jgi:virulence factor Mce-like protein|nr:phospholipid/cholesterol/gamma-HCH transport system substrate-binding protein [Solirubrobacteraceae bacterium]
MRRRRRSGLSTFTVGVVALVVTVIGVYLGFTKSIPFLPHYEVKAAFKSANNIRKASPVRIAGVEVGKVTKVERAHKGDNGTVVTMRINDNGRPLHADAHFKIRPRIFLEGNFFVDVTPGTSSKEVANGHMFPVNQTDTPVQLDEILTALQTDSRDDLKTLLREYSAGLQGKGAKGFNASIKYWKPAYRDSAIVSEALLGQKEHDLSGYVDSAGVVAGALDRNRGQLKALITNFRQTAGAFARENQNLESAIAELPRTLRAAQPALDALNRAFPGLRGFARDLRPGVESSGPTIDVTLPLLHQLRGLVSKPELRGLTSDLRPTIPSLANFTQQAVPLNQQIRESASCQNEVILPWSKDKLADDKFPATGPVYTELPKPFPGLAGESRSGDANGQWFRILAAGGTNLVQFAPGVFGTTALPLLGVNPPKPKARPPLRNDVPCENQQPPDLRSTASAPPPQHQADTSSPAFKARWAKVRQYGMDLMKLSLKREGLAGKFKVADKDITKSDIKGLSK